MSKLFKAKETIARPETVHDTPPAEGDERPAKPASREDEYVERLRVMLVEAGEAGAMSELIGALTCTLARIAGHYGKPYVAGDIVRRFGNYLCLIEDHKAARAEAAEARSAGRPLN